MAAQLTTYVDLKVSLDIPVAVTTWDATLTTIADAVNLQIENYCNRHFTLQEYIETLRGTDDNIVQLRNHPISQIHYAATGADTSLTITYNGVALGSVDIPRTDQNTPITSILLSDGSTVSTIAVSNTATIADVVALIDAEANWSAVVDATTGLYPARALTPKFTGGLLSGDGVCPIMALTNLDLTAINNAWGNYDAARSISSKTLLTVLYTGGYATPYPADLVNGATQLGADVFRDSTRDGALKSEKIGDYAWARDISLYLSEQISRKFQVFTAYRNIPGA